MMTPFIVIMPQNIIVRNSNIELVPGKMENIPIFVYFIF